MPAERDASGTRAKLLFLVTEDWYFCSHRMPVARAAREAGFAVAVATRVRDHGDRIRSEGFALHPLVWRRRGDNLAHHARGLSAIAALYRRERPDILHHVALKPVLFGGIAARLAFPMAGTRPAIISAVMGLGSRLGGGTGAQLLWQALRMTASAGTVIVQNPEDGAALARRGIRADRIALIRGSGVDAAHYVPLPEPEGETMRVALVARMLRSKGVLDAVEAIRRLRADGLMVELLLAGPADPDNPDSLSQEELAGLGKEKGIIWLGPVADVRTVWARAAIAVLPSTYGEGLPKSLLEAAACGRPMIATDIPGNREIVRQGRTGLRVPPHDPVRLADGIAALARDPVARRAMGAEARRVVEAEFSDDIVGEQTVALYRAILAERRTAR